MGKVLVTGGASVIGKKIIEYFLRLEWEVFAHVNDSKLDNPEVTVIKANFKNIETLEKLSLPTVDVLINNAGLFHKDGDDLNQEMILINALAPLMLANKCIAKNKNAKIINILDAWALNEMPQRFMSYCISKKLLAQYTKTMGFYGVSIGATALKSNQSSEIFAKIAKKYSTTIDDILKSLDYILCNKAKKSEILDIARCKK